jgi:formamidopyrimidine-DNA glycosylase
LPELPEVETMVRGIRPHVAGRKIRHFRQAPCRCKPMTIRPRPATIARRIEGLTITAVRRLAKRVVLDLSDGSTMAIEPRMTGLMVLESPPDVEHLRLEWELAGRGDYRSLWFWDQRGLGTCTHYPAGEFLRFQTSGHLGPDALAATREEWLAWTVKTARPIKVALLDQQRIAGIGNLYASEILHVARIAPTLPADRLTVDEVDRIHAATLEVLEEAIRYEGSTLSDGTYRNVLNQDGSYQNAHRVYDRAGEPCRTCGRGVIERIVQAQRSTFFCPLCQAPPKRRRKRIDRSA